MNRSRVRIFSALALLLFTSVFAPRANAATPGASVPELWFAGTRLILDHPQLRDGELAVATDDPGLDRFLVKLGAALSFSPEQRYVVVTTAERRTVSFALGDAHLTNGTSSLDVPFAPYLSGGAAYVPFLALARALGVAPLHDRSAVVLQPQLDAIDVAESGDATYVTLHAATPIKFKRVSDGTDSRLSVALLGLGSALERDRTVATSAVADLVMVTGGTPRNPTVVLTIGTATGTARAIASAPNENELVLAFGPDATLANARAVPSEGYSANYVQSGSRAARTLTATIGSPAPGVPARRSAPLAGPTVTPSSVPTLTPSAPPTLTPSAPPTLTPSADPRRLASENTGGASSDSGAASDAFTRITAVDVASSASGANVRIALTGPATYEWHRLPDNRWYVDVRGATLAIPGREQSVAASALAAVRIKQFAPPPNPVVRVAMQLAGPRSVTLSGDASSLTLAVGADADPGVVRVGTGSIGPGGVVANVVQPSVDPAASGPSPAPPDSIDTTDVGSGAGKSAPLAAVPSGAGAGLADGSTLGGGGGLLAGTTFGEAPWKFGGGAPTIAPGINPHLIVIDPGHGGSDAGSAHNGLVEKDLTLDISRRLRDVLVARGWQVKLTRDDDRDVFAPNDSAHDELQARDDVANNAGARLFVSIHVNAFTDASLNGTTTYYYKSSDLAFSRAVHRHMMSAQLGTADDGVKKANYYVIHHAAAPATLVETAFDSNPTDAAFLANPAWRQKIARAIADGIVDYVTNGRTSDTSDGT
jgi:N-acetylmuramoyl-L-alanine amidase